MNQLTRAELRARILAGHRPASAGAGEPPTPLTRYPDPLPMTQAQRRVWFADQLAGPAPVFTLCAEIHLQASVPEVERACRALVTRHAALRTAVVVDAGVPTVRLRPVADFAVRVIDLRAEPADRAATTLARQLAAERRHRFDPEREPLVRFTYLPMPDGDGRLLVSVHHLVCDGDSLSMLAEQLYSGRIHPGQDRAGEVDYPDYAVWRASAAQQTRIDQQVAARAGALRGAPAPVWIPPDLAVGAGAGAGAGSGAGSGAGPAADGADAGPGADDFEHAVDVPADLVTAVRAVARARRTTDTTVLLAAWARTVMARSGHTDLVFGMPVSVRDHQRLAQTVGLFVNTALIRIAVQPDDPPVAIMDGATTALRDALGQAQAPLESVLRTVYGPAGDARSGIGVCFNKFTVDPRLAAFLPRLPSPGAAEMPLVLEIADDGQRYHTKLIFDRRRYLRSSVALLGRAFVAALGDLVAAGSSAPVPPAGSRPAEIGGSAAQRRPAEIARPAAQPVPAAGPSVPRRLLDSLRRTAADHPTRPAVDGAGRTVGYRELVTSVEELAGRLRAAGLRAGDRVVVDTDRGAPAVIALLACIDADAGYVPLSRRFPERRRRVIAARAGAAWELVGGDDHVIRPLPGPAADASGTPPPPAAVPGYLIFTSGSTGEPHGVQVSTPTLLAHARAVADRFGIGPTDRYLHFAEHAFDAAIEQVVAALLVGATVVPRGEEPWEPARFGALAAATGVTLANLPTPWFAQFATDRQATWPDLTGSRLRTVIAGGAALPAAALAAWADRAPRHIRLLNAYGPTESVITATVGEVTVEAGRPVAAHPSIGTAVTGHEVLVADRQLRPVAVGEVGEAYLGGLLATGYWADPRRTALMFVPDPGPGRTGGRLYRSRDVVRWAPSGTGLEFLRRADDQVKIRGVRIELAEVDAALLGHPEVVDAATTVTGGPDGHLVGWVVLRPGSTTTADDLRAVAACRLPHVAVPRRVHLLDRLPRGAGEKIDRQALRERPVVPDLASGPTSAALAPTAGPAPTDDATASAAHVVARLASELLNTPVGVDSDFFAAGGDSLAAARLAADCTIGLRREVEFAMVFAHPTPRRLAAAVLADGDTGAPSAFAVGPRWPVAGATAALTPAQLRFWLAARRDGPAAQTVVVPLRLTGSLSQPALRAALGALVRRHGILRSRVTGRGAQLSAEVSEWDDEMLAGQLTVASAVTAAGADAAVAATIAAEFDLRVSWFRPFLTALPDGAHVLHLAIHHIAIDGESVGLLVRELLENYDRARRDEPLDRSPAAQYPDVAAALSATHRRAPDLDRAVRALAGTVDLDLSAAAAEPSARQVVGVAVAVAPLAVDAAARRYRVTAYSVVVAAWQRALARWSGRDGFAVGLPVSLRPAGELTDVPGPFLNTVAVRAVPADGSPAAHTVQVQAALAEAYAGRFVPFDEVVAGLAAGRTDPAAPLFQTMVAWQRDHETASVGGLRVSWSEPTPLGVPAALVLFVTATGRRHRLSVRVDTGQVGPGRAADLVRMLAAELDVEPREPGSAVAGSSVGGVAGSGVAGGARVAGPGGGGVVARMLDRAADQPRSVAVAQGGRTLDFAGLDRTVAETAGGLRAAGVDAGTPVLVSLRSHLDTFVAAHALWRLGAVYVPVGPTPPPDRVRLIVASSRATHLLTDQEPPTPPPVRLISWPPVGDPAGGGDPTGGVGAAGAHLPQPAEAAYIMHTSGSTGEPKGVVVEHAQLSAFMDALDSFESWAGADLLIGLGAPTFDASILELCWPAMRGTPVVYPAESATFDPRAVARTLDEARSRASLPAAFATPTLWREVLRVAPDAVRGVATAAGGEAVPGSLVAALTRAGAHPSIGYGPTETTIFCITGAAEPDGGSGQLGRPLPGARLSIRDERGVTEAVTEGELFIGGPLVTRGYAGAPRATAVRFVPDPQGHGERMYRSGDRVRRQADGILRFLGRRDDQVKVRGVRIEIGEVEACLSGHPLVRSVAVLPRGADQLVAAVVVADDAAGVPSTADSCAEIRSWAANRLVEQAVPLVVPVPRLPVNANGKVDRRALAAELATATADRPAAASTVDDPVAALVAVLWHAQLGTAVDDVAADFFAVGGHSIALLHVVEGIEELFGIEFPIVRAFAARTVAAMAQEVRAIAGERAAPTAAIALEVFGGGTQ